MKILSTLQKLAAVSTCLFFSSGFVFVNGPAEAKLDVSEESPVTEFVWNGKVPALKDVAGFRDGIFL